jgi:hypothetical protein
MIDSLLIFSKQINQLIGKDTKKLFGMDGVSLKNTEIYINNKKGMNCSLDNSTIEAWPLGDIVKENILNVSDAKSTLNKLIFINCLNKL